MKRGYFGIGIYRTKNPLNVGSLWRSALNFEADFIFTIGRRYQHEASDTVKALRHIPLYHYLDFDDFNAHRPLACPLIGVEQSAASIDLVNFVHPQSGIYLLGAEDAGIPQGILYKCQSIVHISTPMCINVAAAGSIVMYDRSAKAEARRAMVA